MSEKKLAGKVALITGASKGLGESMALALAQAGARVALVSRDEKLLSKVAGAIRAQGGEAEVFLADVTKEDQVLALEKQVVAKMGRVQILINNAGINIRKPITDFTVEEWHRIIDTNLTSVFMMCRAFVPHMRGTGYGRILTMSSILSHVGLPGRVPYCSSKAGVLGLTRALALELAADKITVNGISPGPFATEMNLPVMNNPEANQQFISKIPAGHWGRVEDIGQLAVYLCSPDAGFINGTDIVIDGGWLAQ